MEPTHRIAALLAAMLAFTLAAQAADRRETRAVGEFTGIGLSAPVKIQVTQGDTASLALEGPDEALAQIETEVVDRSLQVRLKRGARLGWNHKVVVHVTSKRIDALAISGSGDIVAPAINAESLKISISGSGDVRVGGKVEGLSASIAGSGDIRAGELDAQRVKVSIAGSGDATVRARQALTVSVAGSGDVRYYGDPTVEKSVLGSGSVRRLGPASS
jgi:hypothetical protein